jgi:hypothetical protein
VVYVHNLTFVAADSIVEGGGMDTTRAGDPLTIGLGGGGVRGPIMTIVRYLRIMYIVEVAKTVTQYCANNSNV